MFTEDFSNASGTGQKKIPFGKYANLSLDQVSQLPGGVDYLKSLLNERSVGTPLKKAITDYIQQRTINA